uniref:Uncharacterized protein n=1 Tax=Acrobeloides nanus TaxID=290746 RepID=A0A914DBP0_9BILA
MPRDLIEIRKWFAKQTPEGYVDEVFELAKIKYVLTTNIPFEKKETVHWYPKAKEFDTSRFHTGLRVDQLLTGNWKSIKEALDEMAIEHTIQGVKQLLEKWTTIMKPKYFMAAIPPTLEFPSDEEMSTYAPSKSTPPRCSVVSSCRWPSNITCQSLSNSTPSGQSTRHCVKAATEWVLDQLIYKWKHLKAVIGGVLQDMYVKLFHAGWSLTREEIQRDVERLFGGAYEEFMQK